MDIPESNLWYIERSLFGREVDTCLNSQGEGGAVRFSILLFGLSQLLRIASFVNGPFKRRIRNTSVRLLIKTRDNSRGRLFIFTRGRIASHSGALHDSDVALVFKDAAAGFSVMRDKRKEAVFNAAARGEVHLEGMNVWALWFEDVVKVVL